MPVNCSHYAIDRLKISKIYATMRFLNSDILCNIESENLVLHICKLKALDNSKLLNSQKVDSHT